MPMVARSLLVSLAVLGVGCHQPAPEPAPRREPPREPVTKARPGMGVLGIQRAIPLHITVLTRSCTSNDDCRQPASNMPDGSSVCDATTRTCTSRDHVNGVQSPDPLSHEQLSMSVARTNSIFAPAGVHFYVSHLERIVANDFADIDRRRGMNTAEPWSLIWHQIAAIYPQASSGTTWASPDYTTDKIHWLDLANARWGARNEIRIFVPLWGISGGHGMMPHQGRSVPVSTDVFGVRHGGRANHPLYDYAPTFAHEVGHFFGLPHTFDDQNDAGLILTSYLRDPWTAQPWKNSDFWDLVYAPATAGGSHTFFATRTDAQPWETLLRTIDTSRADRNPEHNHWCTTTNGHTSCRSGSSCCGNCDGHGSVECFVGTAASNVTYKKGPEDPNLLGLSFAGTGDNPGASPPTFHRTVNVMSYLAGFDAELSSSQIRLIQGSLRHDLPILGNASQPVETRWGYRNVLGQGLNREPAESIDLDGDGKRDLAVFQMDTNHGNANYAEGQFRVLLSSRAYDKAQELTVNFGQLGDTPVLADYNGDGVTDFAVWRAGSHASPYDNRASWVWCLSTRKGKAPATHDCSSPQSVQHGLRSDIPLPGLSFSPNAKDRWLAFYRPESGLWSWRKTTDPAVTTRLLGGPGQVPLPGLYGADTTSDLAVYEPSTATFKLLASEAAWSGAPVTKALNHVWATEDPAVTGLMGQPQRGAWAGLHCPPGKACSTSRRTFQLFSPINGSWETVTNPTLTADATTSSCFTSNTEQSVPVTGLFDRNGDGLNDYARVEHNFSSDTLSVHLLDATATGCSPQASLRIDGLPPRTLVFFVGDMTGDGKNELMLLDPQLMTWTWRTSESGYATQGGSRQFGDESIDQFMLPLLCSSLHTTGS